MGKHRENGMAYEYILVEKTAGVAILTLNRPDKLNAMNRQLTAELQDAVKQMSTDDEVGCIVLTGAGKRAFSAGGDIHEQREDDRRYTQAELDARNATRSRGSYDISACPKPTIGMMNGLAFGGGAVLASSLDIASAASIAASAFWLSPTAASTVPGLCRIKSGGPSPKSCCSLAALSRPKKPIVLVCSITWYRVANCRRKPSSWRR
jgi:enoyl-CoA hydratase/carnithine racemase